MVVELCTRLFRKHPSCAEKEKRTFSGFVLLKNGEEGKEATQIYNEDGPVVLSEADEYQVLFRPWGEFEPGTARLQIYHRVGQRITDLVSHKWDPLQKEIKPRFPLITRNGEEQSSIIFQQGGEKIILGEDRRSIVFSGGSIKWVG